MTLGALLARALARLRAGGIGGAERDARRLVAHAAGLAPERLTLHLNEVATDETAARLDGYVAARLDRRPVSQIVGDRLFWGRHFRVTGDVLDPRPETETLIAVALAGSRPARLVDLGTGTGCIAVTLLAEWPEARGVATDTSAAALAVARENADALGVGGRLALLRSDWWQGVSGRFDLVVSNPPYVAEAEIAGLAPEVRLWEPRAALTPGGDGLGALRALADGLAAHLAPGGRALFEFGAGQGEDVARIMAGAGFSATLHADLDGRPRVAEARRRA